MHPTAIVANEESAVISGNSASSISCSTSVSKLECSSLEVQSAYVATANDPFAQAAKIVPTGGTSRCPAVFAPSTIRYVAKNGSDANDGSVHSPWLTLQHAANSVQPGQTVLVGDGTYDETVKFKTGGTATAPIVFRALNPGKAKVAPSSTAGNSGFVFWVSALSYITIQDFEISSDPSAIAGIEFEAGSHNSAIGNLMHAIANNLTACVTAKAIEAAGDSMIVSGNRIWDVGSPRSVPFVCNQQHGISTWRGTGGIVQNNILYDIWQGYALHFDARGFSNWVVTNNTVYNAGGPQGGPFVFWCESGTCDNNVFNNNIFMNGGGPRCLWEYNNGGTIGSRNTYLNNLLLNCGTNNMLTGVPQNTVTADPLFVNPAAGDFRLLSTSPARDAGTVNGAPSSDIDGTPRPTRNAVDMGAYESL